jgi:amidase
VGEDTGGSIRVPASFCNLVGLRPTVGLVSRYGLSPLVKTQDTPGPMTRTVRDAALMLDVLAGFDPKDPYTAAALIAGPPRGGSYAAHLSEGALATARIGVLNSVFAAGDECAPVNKVIRDTLSKFSTGTTLIDIEIPKLDEYVTITSTYNSRSRYDIDNFLAAHPVLRNVTVESIHSTQQFHQALPLFDRIGTGIKHPYDDPHYALRLDERGEFQRIVIGIMAENNLDAIVFPSVQIPPPTIEDVLGPRFKEHGFPTNTSIGSQLRQPAISVPVGFTDNGLPVGLELLGIPYSEQKLLELAFGIETLTKARRVPEFKSI